MGKERLGNKTDSQVLNDANSTAAVTQRRIRWEDDHE